MLRIVKYPNALSVAKSALFTYCYIARFHPAYLLKEEIAMTIDRDDTPVYTQEFFEDCLRRGGWKPVALEEDLYLMNYQGKHGAFIIYGKFMPSQFLVGFSGVYPYSIPDEKMPAILEYIHYTNWVCPLEIWS
jgi:hypothetical protein